MTSNQMNIDPKERQLLDYFHDVFKRAAFDEKDTYAFFILLRRIAKDSGVSGWMIVAIGDLIAHRRRDRGKIHASLIAVDRSPHLPSKTKVPGVYPLEINEFTMEINHLLCALGYLELPDDVIEDMLLCVFSLMQHSIYAIGPANETADIRVIVAEKQIMLITNIEDRPPVVLAAVKNRYTSIVNETLDKGTPITVNRGDNGCLVILRASSIKEYIDNQSRFQS